MERDEWQRAAWRVTVAQSLDARSVVFVDEMGTNVSLSPLCYLLTLRRSQGVELGYYEQRHPRTLFRLSAQRLFPYHRHRPLGHDRRSCLPRQNHPLPRLRGVRIGGLVEAR